MLGTCLSIFSARVVDVSLGTLRTVYTVKGRQFLASSIAFVEVFIWFIVAREALNTEVTSLLIPIFYSLGYATGTLLGTYISNNFVNGLMCVQVIVKKNNKSLIDNIRKNGYGLSIVDLNSGVDKIKKEMLFIQTSKRNLKKLLNIIKEYDPLAFIMVNETKYAQNGVVK